jgi:molybdate transport system ATP-binding protein
MSLELRGRATVGGLVLEVDLAVAPGETVALVGPNGAGKSTLLRVLAGLHPLDDGIVRLDGTALDEPAHGTWVPPERRSIGVVFQDLLLFDHLDVLDNVAFGLVAQGARRRAARAASRPWLDRLGLAGVAGNPPGTLSGGQAQRVALARALAPRPRALLLDEPLSALDADVRGSVRRDLRSHLDAHPGPRLIVTHDPLDAALLADWAIVLEAGRVTATGTLEELVARPRSAWAAELAGTNLLRARSDGHELVLDGGGVVVAADTVGAGPVLVAIRPAAVALHRQHPQGSPRNVWPATVAGIEGYAERRRVRLAGAVPLVAEVTASALAELQLQSGAEVWASVKATEVIAYPA